MSIKKVLGFAFAASLVIFTVVLIASTTARARSPHPQEAAAWISGTPILRRIHGPIEQHVLSREELQNLGRVDAQGMLVPLNIGDQYTFITYNFETGQSENIQATLRATGNHVNVWVANNQNVITATVESIRDEFNDHIYPTDTQYFGEPPDIDGDPKIHILIFDIQDGYDPITNPTYYAGYFDSADQSGQNNMDMFYMDCDPGVPGSDGFYGTLAHEFQHMIHFNHDNNEEPWLDEGLADFAMVANGYGLPNSHINAFRDTPATTLIDWDYDDPLKHYGASFLFIEYMCELVERNGKTVSPFTRALVSEGDNGINGIDDVLPGYLPSDRDTFEEVFEMWLITNYARDTSSDYRYTRPGLEGFHVSVQSDSNGDGYTEKLLKNGQRFERKNESVPRWAAEYWAFQVGLKVADVQAIIDGENNWWPWGNLDNPSYTAIFMTPSGVQNIDSSRNVDHTFSVTNNSAVTPTLVIIVGSRAGGIDSKGDYDLIMEASSASPNILAPTQSAPDLVGSANDPYKAYIDVEVKTEARTFVKGLGRENFGVRIGSSDANILTARELADKYVLEIQPPAQSTDGLYDLTVTVFENPDTETEAIQYSSLTQNNVDAMLVIDRSGSMGGTPIENARNSAKFFVDLMYQGDMVGVASYNSSSRVDFPLTAITSTAVKDDAKNAINAIYVSGRTSIGAGLEDGRDELTGKGNTNHPWSIVLLSDGQENEPPYVSDVLPSIVPTKIKVFSIGLGDVDEALMRDIAYQTNGQYYYTPSDAQLIGIYNSISGEVAGRQTLYNISSSVQQGETQTDNVPVDPSVSEAVFSLAWNNASSDLNLTLQTPSGRTIDPQTASTDPNIEFVSGQTYEYYKVYQPEAGNWTVSVYGAVASVSSMAISSISTQASGEAYNLTAQAVTRLTLDSEFDKSSYAVGDAINLQVSLADHAPITGAWVRAEIHRPDVTVDTMTLHDDGMHADGLAGDGVYSGFYPRTDDPGSYRFDLVASGHSSLGDEFNRLLSLSTVVVSASDSDWDSMPDNWEDAVGLNSSVNDANEDPDADGLVNLHEYQNGTDPFTWDTDGDTLSDGQEVNTYGTNPTNEDTDLGGVDDGTVEGTFPSGKWSVFDNDGASHGEYYWDEDDYKPHQGSRSAWPANGGADAIDPQYADYPNDLDSWMVYGPFDLSDAADAELLFHYWNQSEQGYDYLFWGASVNGANFYGSSVSGDSGGWQAENFDLTNVYTLGDLTGQPAVWIAFVFVSDYSITDKGAFVDDIMLRKSAVRGVSAEPATVVVPERLLRSDAFSLSVGNSPPEYNPLYGPKK